MTNFIRSGKDNPCPVCGRVKDGDCRWYSDLKTILCHTYPDGTGHDEIEWHFTKTIDDGMWGTYIQKEERGKPFTKSPRPKSEKHYYYPDRDGNNLVKVTRIDDGEGDKIFYQSHWNDEKWANKCPKEIRTYVPIYRYAEVRQAIDRGEQVFIVEGEEVADRLWKLRIPATTTIGGSGGYKS